MTAVEVSAADLATSYAPRTRGGQMISHCGFAVIAASTAAPAVEDAVGPLMGLGFVVMVLAVVAAPRLIRPGCSWFRAVLPTRLCASAYGAAAIVALAAVVGDSLFPASSWGWTAAAVISAGGVAVTTLSAVRRVE